MKINIGGLELKNPVIAASGTFGFGAEYSMFYPLEQLGGISCKGLTLEPRKGNRGVRIAETPAGILNSVGLENPGVDEFIKTYLPLMKKYNTAVIANIAGSTIEDYIRMAEILDKEEIDAFEVNVSCPNVKCGGASFGTDPETIEKVTSAIKAVTKKTVIVKLTPNVTSIVECARAAEAGGADSVSLINTILGMKINIKTGRPVLQNNYGGLSGPAVMPVAVRMVNEVFRSVKIPIIGMGGISSWEDAVEFIMAGATAVMVGTASFVEPTACADVAKGLMQYFSDNHINDIAEIRGSVQLN